MAVLTLTIDDAVMANLNRLSHALDRTAEDLAECAVAEAVLSAMRHMSRAMPGGPVRPPLASPPAPPPPSGRLRPRTPEDGQRTSTPEDGQPVTTR